MHALIRDELGRLHSTDLTPRQIAERSRAQGAARQARYRAARDAEAAPDRRAVDRALATALARMCGDGAHGRERPPSDTGLALARIRDDAVAYLVVEGFDRVASDKRIARRLACSDVPAIDKSMGGERRRMRRSRGLARAG